VFPKGERGGYVADCSTHRCFRGVKFTLAGGDRRHDYLAARLASLGGEVCLARRRPPVDEELGHSRCLEEALEGANVLVCPMGPFRKGGRVWSEDPEDRLVLSEAGLAGMAPPALVFAGTFPEDVAAAARRVGCRLTALGEMDEIAIRNSVPTAEGALLMALERSTVTINRSPSVVLGYGRTGRTLAGTLRALGARVRVVARRPEVRAWAVVDGCEAFDVTEVGEAVRGARFVFNTIPALILTGRVLAEMDPRVVIVDLGSGEGGTDFTAARSLGLAAVLAPALPGRVAPETAAVYLGDIIVRITAGALEAGGCDS